MSADVGAETNMAASIVPSRSLPAASAESTSTSWACPASIRLAASISRASWLPPLSGSLMANTLPSTWVRRVSGASNWSGL